MVQLDAGNTARCSNLVCYAGQTRDVHVVESTQLAGEALAERMNLRGTGHHHAKTTGGSHGQPVKLFIGQGAVFMALGVGQWGKQESIGQRFTAREMQWVHDIRHGLSLL